MKPRRPRSQPASDDDGDGLGSDGDALGSDGEVSRNKPPTWASTREPVQALVKAQRLFESCDRKLNKENTEGSAMYRTLAAWVKDERFLSRNMEQKTKDYKMFANFLCHFHTHRDRRRAFNELQLPPSKPHKPTADEIRPGLYQSGLDPKPRNRALEEAMKEPKRRSRPPGSSSRKKKPSPPAKWPGLVAVSPVAPRRYRPPQEPGMHFIGSRSWSPGRSPKRSPLKTFKRDRKT